MSIFVTGSTGYLGSYVINTLLDETEHDLLLMVRGKDQDEQRAKLWKALQLHMGSEKFWDIQNRISFVRGDLTAPRLGLDEADYQAVMGNAESVLHIAASLNRKSEKACLNTNLRGTLSVIKTARELADRGQLRRYSHVSTVAVAGHRKDEVVTEDESIDWNRSDYDPYARTKKFGEHMGRELLPDVQKTFFRPSIILGDSRMPDTSQFDMARAFAVLADLPIVPMDGRGRLDIAPANFVGTSIARLHVKENPNHDCYHLSSGTRSRSAEEIARTTAEAAGKRVPRFVPRLANTFDSLVNGAAGLNSRNAVQYVGSLMKVFWPYITFNTVFDNSRVTSELGITPTPFTEYCGDLYKYVKRVDFEYPYVALPERPASAQVPRVSARAEARA